MSGIFPNVIDGAVNSTNAQNAYNPTITPINTTAEYFSSSCNIKLRAEVLNSLISEIICAVDSAGNAYDASSRCNLSNAIKTLISLQSAGIVSATCANTAPAGPQLNDYWLRTTSTIVLFKRSATAWVQVPAADGPAMVVCRNCSTAETYINCGTSYISTSSISNVSSGEVPIGGMIDFAGQTLPSGYLYNDGSEVSRTVYPLLFGVIGVSFGGGDGSTTFNLPDRRGRVGVGRDNMDNAGGLAQPNRVTTPGSGINGDLLGSAGGQQSNTLLATNMPPAASGGAGNYISGPTAAFTAGWPLNGGAPTPNYPPIAANINPYPTGVSAPFSNMQPSIICNSIIRAI